MINWLLNVVAPSTRGNLGVVMSTFLLHLNIEVPDDALTTAADVSREVFGAIKVGVNADETPALVRGTWDIVFAEEL